MPAVINSEAHVDNDEESPSESTSALTSPSPSNTSTNANETSNDKVKESLQAAQTSSPPTPNNDFDQHSASDFIETLQDEKLHDAKKQYHRKRFMEAWDKIHSLVGREVSVGKDIEEIKWKVVPGAFRDDLCFYLIEHDCESEKGNLNFVHDVHVTDSMFGCLKYLWPGDMKEDLDTLNECVKELNIERKKNIRRRCGLWMKQSSLIFMLC